MKKRLITAFLTLFALAALTPAAFAAVETGGVEYLWYIERGEVLRDDNDEAVGFEGDSLRLSADGGLSYAELPGLREESLRIWGAMDAAVTALDGGGLRVEARDMNSPSFTWRRDYSAGELAQALTKAEATSVAAVSTNGTVVVGRLWVHDQDNGDPSQPSGWGYGWGYDRLMFRLVWGRGDGTWTMAEQPEGVDSCKSAWWDGSAFYLEDYSNDAYTSADGLHWTKTEEAPIRNKLAYTADLGRYHFEIVNTGDWKTGFDVYVMDQSTRNMGALLPHMGQAIRAQGIGVTDLLAWYGPNDTVCLGVYSDNNAYSIAYPISSLDWVLENQSVAFRAESGMETVTDGKASLGLAAKGNRYDALHFAGELIRDDGTHWQGTWKKVEGVPFTQEIELLPYNGKTFMVVDNARGQKRLYASADGLAWTEVTALRPEGINADSRWAYTDYAFFWTGERYYARLKAGEMRHGMMGMSGGQWYGKNTEVYFLDESFNVVDSYDFGRLVAGVAYVNGAYYAEVVDGEGSSDHEVANGYHYTLYRSADGKTWTALPRTALELNVTREKSIAEYNDGIPDVLLEQVGGSTKGNLPTGDPDKPLRTSAQVGKYRFILDQGYQDRWEVHLLAGNAADEYWLREFTTAIRESWISPGEVTAEDVGDGNIRVTVTDLSTPSMKCSFTYTTQELDQWVTQPTTMGYRGRFGEEACKPGVADLAAIEMPLGEVEIVYRDADTDGKYMWYESVPWSNSVELLPFSGKDFMVLDRADGKLWLSGNGKTWHEATGDWLRLSEGYEQVRYALTWTGKNYLACCYLSSGKGDDTRVSGDAGKVFLLDEDLNVVSSHDFGHGVEKVGVRDEVCYAIVGPETWDERGRYGTEVTGGTEPRRVLWWSTDGVNWNETDLVQVRESLQEQG